MSYLALTTDKVNIMLLLLIIIQTMVRPLVAARTGNRGHSSNMFAPFCEQPAEVLQGTLRREECRSFRFRV